MTPAAGVKPPPIRVPLQVPIWQKVPGADSAPTRADLNVPVPVPWCRSVSSGTKGACAGSGLKLPVPLSVPDTLNRYQRCRCRCRFESAGAGAGQTQPAPEMPVPVCSGAAAESAAAPAFWGMA